MCSSKYAADVACCFWLARLRLDKSYWYTKHSGLKCVRTKNLADEKCALISLLTEIGTLREQLANVRKKDSTQAKAIVNTIKEKTCVLDIHIANKFAAQLSDGVFPSLLAVFDDLLSLPTMFGKVKYDKAGKVSVTTEDVILSDDDVSLNFGPFTLTLAVDTEHDKYCSFNNASEDIVLSFETVADVPLFSSLVFGSHKHPHVEDSQLCLGDGEHLVKNLVASLSIFDFFQVVKSILFNYNAGSAYVALTNWFSSQCIHCACAYDRDNSCACYDCDQEFCDDCASYCDNDGCGHCLCKNCGQVCFGCATLFCDSCVDFSECDSCNSHLCKGCMSEDPTLCIGCYDKKLKKNLKKRHLSSV